MNSLNLNFGRWSNGRDKSWYWYKTTEYYMNAANLILSVRPIRVQLHTLANKHEYCLRAWIELMTVHHVWFNRTTSTSSQNALIECACLCVANPIRYFLSLIAPTHTHNSNRIRLLLADCYNWMLFYISIIEFSRMHTAHTHRNRTELNGNEFPMNIQMISSLSSVAELFIVWFH